MCAGLHHRAAECACAHERPHGPIVHDDTSISFSPASDPQINLRLHLGLFNNSEIVMDICVSWRNDTAIRARLIKRRCGPLLCFGPSCMRQPLATATCYGARMGCGRHCCMLISYRSL